MQQSARRISSGAASSYCVKAFSNKVSARRQRLLIESDDTR
jgi:hypothetical protein